MIPFKEKHLTTIKIKIKNKNAHRNIQNLEAVLFREPAFVLQKF